MQFSSFFQSTIWCVEANFVLDTLFWGVGRTATRIRPSGFILFRLLRHFWSLLSLLSEPTEVFRIGILDREAVLGTLKRNGSEFPPSKRSVPWILEQFNEQGLARAYERVWTQSETLSLGSGVFLTESLAPLCRWQMDLGWFKPWFKIPAEEIKPFCARAPHLSAPWTIQRLSLEIARRRRFWRCEDSRLPTTMMRWKVPVMHP